MNILKETKATILCEVVCDLCTRVEAAAYRNSETVTSLKKRTQDWKTVKMEDENGISTYQLCPDCLYRVKNKWKEKV